MNSPLPDARTEYTSRKSRFQAQLSRLERRAGALANIRLVLFLAGLALAILAWAGKLPRNAWGGALAAFAGFVVAAAIHDRVLGRERRMRHRVAIQERGLARVEERWGEVGETGERFVDSTHPYASDLDVFGSLSLFQRLDTTATRPGEEKLAGWLKAPASLEEVAERQKAVAELAGAIDFREDLETEGRMLAETKPDPSRLLEWAEGPRAFEGPFAWPYLPVVLPVATLASYLAGRFGVAPGWLWYVPLAVQIAIIVLTLKLVAGLHARLSAPGERLLRFEKLFQVVEANRFQSPLLVRLSQRMSASGAPPSVEMRRLARALSFLELRSQPLFHIPLTVLTLWDLIWVGSLERWQRRCGSRMRGWLDTLAELEALGSLAAYAMENPDHCWPELSGEGPQFVAQGLGHPLLPPSRRVVNQVALDGPGHALVITGSNMAGKTTLLRTLGVNTVLALAGAPACAKSLRLSRLEVHTSMRVQDSLARGLSYFYAELERLKTVVDACRDAPVLFLLDEVLQGTNTAERQVASKAIVRHLVDHGAIGAVATHDLGLTTLEHDSVGKAKNVHFTDRIENGEMSFDYLLRPGVVATTNALALLRKVGIEVELPPAREQSPG